MGGALAASGSPPSTDAPGGASDKAEGEHEYLSWEDLDLGVDKVPLIHKDWENQFIFREDFGQSFSPPTDVSPTRTAPSMEPAPAHSPLNADAFESLLANHPNRSFVEWLVTSIREGFKNYSDMPETTEAVHAPLHSAVEWKEIVTEWLTGEVAAGRMQVFSDRPHPFAVASPVGEVPKHGGKHRIIHHLSKSKRGSDGSWVFSVNECISEEEFTCEYVRVQEMVAALSLLAQHGDTEWSACDIVHGFRNMPLHPSCYHEHALVWEGRWYVDVAVGFGSRCAPFSFSALSGAGAWVVQERLTKAFGTVEVVTAQGMTARIPRASVFVLMDDYSVVSNKDIAAQVERILVDTLTELGLPTQPTKDKHHGPDGKYLGWWLDTRRRGIISLPHDKRDPWLAELSSIVASRYTTVKAMERNVGRLTHAHPVHRRLRPLVAEMLRIIRTRSPHRVKVTDRLKEDLRTWCHALRTKPTCTFSKLIDSHQGKPTRDWACGDASGAGGFGWYTAVSIYYDQWGPELDASLDDADSDVSSTLQETACYVAAAMTWMQSAGRGDTFTYFTDAKNVYFNWVKGRSPTSRVNNIIRRLALALHKHGCYTRVVWQRRNTPDAKSADLLSRAAAQATCADRFRGLNPSHEGQRSNIQPSILECILQSTRR